MADSSGFLPENCRAVRRIFPGGREEHRRSPEASSGVSKRCQTPPRRRACTGSRLSTLNDARIQVNTGPFLGGDTTCFHDGLETPDRRRDAQDSTSRRVWRAIISSSFVGMT
jgi:hypothetical protein